MEVGYNTETCVPIFEHINSLLMRTCDELCVRLPFILARLLLPKPFTDPCTDKMFYVK